MTTTVIPIATPTAIAIATAIDVFYWVIVIVKKVSLQVEWCREQTGIFEKVLEW